MIVELIAITSDAEKIIEDAARTCYQSKAGEKHVVGDLISKLIKSGHHSVLEHAYATFRINGCSRSMTHQLVRHRLCSFSQQSQRYTRHQSLKTKICFHRIDGKKSHGLSKFSIPEEIQICDLYKANYAMAEIAEASQVNPTTIRSILIKYCVEIRSNGEAARLINYTYFDIIDAPIKAFILGFIVADGNIIGDNLIIDQAEENLITLYGILKELKIYGNLEEIEPENENCQKMYRLWVGSKHIIGKLLQYGITSNKSNNIDIKKIIRNIPKEYHVDFFRGIFEGDGCIYFRENDKNGYKDFSFIISGNQQTCKVFQEFLIENLNIGDTKIYEDKNSKGYKLIYGGTPQVGKIMKFFYSSPSVLFFPKKIYRASLCLPDIKLTYEECFDLLEIAYGYVIPPSFRDNYMIFNDYFKIIYMCQKLYSQMLNEGIKPEDARFVLPNACCTEIVVSANFREFRHIFEVRCSKHAQWEIRVVAKEMLKQLYEKSPSVFEDMKQLIEN